MIQMIFTLTRTSDADAVRVKYLGATKRKGEGSVDRERTAALGDLVKKNGDRLLLVETPTVVRRALVVWTDYDR